MRKLVFILMVFNLCIIKSNGQESVKKQLADIFARLGATSNIDSLANEALDEIFFKPDLLNDIFSKNLKLLERPALAKYRFIRDLNIKFKSFQADTLPVSLGFEYKYDNSWIKNKTQKNSVFFQSYNLGFNGNVAFKKRHNPNDFLESSLLYDGSFMWGGQAKEIDDATSDLIERIEDSIIARQRAGKPYLDLYREVNNLINVSDQFYLGVKGKFAFESNQDFSKQQFVPGILIGVGAKGWDKKEALRYFNILDYPFALIRLLTGTDAEFNVYGATFPSFLIGLDYVIPEKDEERQALTGSEDSYTRLRFEIGFKTRVARIGKEMIHFSSNYRWYKELNPDENIELNKLDRFSFLVAALESTNGLFVSYTTGRLPFDRITDQVYALGFRYDLGNFKD